MAIEALERIMKQVRMNSQDLNHINQEPLQKKNALQSKKSSYKCDKCKDTGWILVPDEDDNSVYTIMSCECREKEKLHNQWKAAGINPVNNIQTFSNFKIWNDCSKEAKNTVMNYYKDFKNIHSNRQNSILLCGQVGSGKTHLSVALALNLIRKNIKVVYMPYRSAITKIKQNMLNDEYYNKTIAKYQTCEVLLMDDLFKGKINDTDINIIFEILSYRYLNRLPIIVSTENTAERLLYVDESIGSRIYEMCRDYIVEIKKSIKNNYRLRES